MCDKHGGKYTKGCPKVESFACCECCEIVNCAYRHDESTPREDPTKPPADVLPCVYIVVSKTN